MTYGRALVRQIATHSFSARWEKTGFVGSTHPCTTECLFSLTLTSGNWTRRHSLPFDANGDSCYATQLSSSSTKNEYYSRCFSALSACAQKPAIITVDVQLPRNSSVLISRVSRRIKPGASEADVKEETIRLEEKWPNRFTREKKRPDSGETVDTKVRVDIACRDYCAAIKCTAIERTHNDISRILKLHGSNGGRLYRSVCPPPMCPMVIT